MSDDEIILNSDDDDQTPSTSKPVQKLAPIFYRSQLKQRDVADDDFDIILDDKDDNIQAAIQESLENQPIDALTLDFSQCPGIDTETWSTWIYPSNVEYRVYQVESVRESLNKNTLVALPTGLGKTCIAAVIMYNFYRWYPCGKILFVGPTKPLVEQQIEAILKFVNFKLDETAIMTGRQKQSDRNDLWHRRIFFMTAETCVNDIKRFIFDVSDVRCLILDEAHKASGDHAYCQLVQLINDRNRNFRIVGLTATPCENPTKLQDLVNTLTIEKLLTRTEQSNDVRPYIHGKGITNVQVSLSAKLRNYKRYIVTDLEKELDKLYKYKLIHNPSVEKNSAFQIMNIRRMPHTAEILKRVGKSAQWSVTVAHGLLTLLETCEMHGSRLLHKKVNDMITTKKINSPNLIKLRNELDEEFRDVDDLAPNDDDCDDSNKLDRLLGTDEKNEKKFLSLEDKRAKLIDSHPKLARLIDIILQHFQENCDGTRVIVFSSLRESIAEITELLELYRSEGVRPAQFKGQGNSGKPQVSRGGTIKVRGLRQKEQISVIERFRTGDVNTLVSTCIGEEGLDVGDVDLIILYDSCGSSTRLTQRIGRTGRKRYGRVVAFATQGKEYIKMVKANNNKQAVEKNTMSDVKKGPMMCISPRMLPKGFFPVKEVCDLSEGIQPYDRRQAMGKQKRTEPKKRKPKTINVPSKHPRIDKEKEQTAQPLDQDKGGNLKLPFASFKRVRDNIDRFFKGKYEDSEAKKRFSKIESPEKVKILDDADNLLIDDNGDDAIVAPVIKNAAPMYKKNSQNWSNSTLPSDTEVSIDTAVRYLMKTPRPDAQGDNLSNKCNVDPGFSFVDEPTNVSNSASINKFQQFDSDDDLILDDVPKPVCKQETKPKINVGFSFLDANDDLIDINNQESLPDSSTKRRELSNSDEDLILDDEADLSYKQDKSNVEPGFSFFDKNVNEKPTDDDDELIMDDKLEYDNQNSESKNSFTANDFAKTPIHSKNIQAGVNQSPTKTTPIKHLKKSRIFLTEENDDDDNIITPSPQSKRFIA